MRKCYREYYFEVGTRFVLFPFECGLDKVLTERTAVFSEHSKYLSCLGIGVKLSALAVEMKRISCSGTRTEVSRTRSPDPPNAENVSSSHRLAWNMAEQQRLRSNGV